MRPARITAMRSANLECHAQIVGDEQHAEIELVFDIRQQLQHLRLHGDVERRHRLIRHQDFRLQCKRTGDADPLPLTAGELVRIARSGCCAQAHKLEQFGDARLRCGAADAMDYRAFGNDVADTLARIERTRTGPETPSAHACDMGRNCRRER